MNYNDRIGTLTLLQPDVARPYQLRTNIGRSVSQGVEAYVEFDPVVALAGRSRVGYVSLFGSVGLTDARYFTRRAGGYPGPGILPADGRTGYVSVGVRL
jgi:Fe(3+) dicitrate transport protein